MYLKVREDSEKY